MPNKKNQTSVGQMIQRCHKWRQKRKQYIDLARQTSDEIERERLLQTAEHYGRIVNEEQVKIDSQRDPKDKTPIPEEIAETSENNEQNDSGDDEEIGFPDFITNLK
jgi:DNA repair exonuclease SbcCD nuclease subunit